VQRGRPRHDDILTPREWEVLGLLRAGLTNEQIAGRLGFNLATAKFHVSEIMGKLGVETREAAAAWPGRPKAARALASPWLFGRLQDVVAAVHPGRLAGAAVIAGVLAVLILLLLGVLLSSSRFAADEEAIPDRPSLEPVTQTTVITYAPVTTPVKREGGGRCSSPSGVLSRDGALRCTGP
jgi:DNA-binding CsgD family transcriptional regulator